jgi:hypothetical protein
MAASTYTDARLIAVSKSFVNVVSHGDTGHGTRQVIVGRETKTWCKEYWGIPCEVHVEGSKAVGNFMKGSYGTPTTILCDPDGKELFRKPGAMSGAELAKEMAAVLAKTPGEKVSIADWSGAKKSLADADAHLEKGEWKKALELVTKVAKHKAKAVAALADEARKRIEEKGAALLEEAQGKLESEKEEAKKLLRKVADEFKGLDCAKKAAELLKSQKE